MVLILQLGASSETYLVDVGFGGLSLVRPIPLIEGAEVQGAAPPEVHRLVRGKHPKSSLDAEEPISDPTAEWRLEVNYKPVSQPADWMVLYQFSLTECFEEDREQQNFAVSQRNIPGIPFYSNVLCVKHFEVPGSTEILGRRVMMGNCVHERIGSSNRTVVTLHTEAERIDALKQYFGVIIQKENVIYIRGRVPALE